VHLDSRPRHRHIRVRLVNEAETKKIRGRLGQGDNILKQCLGELERVKQMEPNHGGRKQCR
jgi:hypothetical protein